MMHEMKRRREMKKDTSMSEIRVAIQELSHLQLISSSSGVAISAAAPTDASLAAAGNNPPRELTPVPIRTFLSLARLMVQVLDKIGPTMTVLRQDIHDNIQRLESLLEKDPVKYSNMIEMLRKEASEGNARKTDSCSRALVWLTRSLYFTASLLKNTSQEPVASGRSMENIVEDSYSVALKPWHGWISMAAYKVALKLLPDTRTFLDLLVEKGHDLKALREEVQCLHSMLLPFLDNIHFHLRFYGLDQLKCK